VAVDNGVVTLTGSVGSYAEKLAAERATRRVKGVRGIAEEIEVRYPGGIKTSDEELVQRALNALSWDITVPFKDIKVTVDKGWITLTGEVLWNYQRSAAEIAVRNLSGVLGVSNNVTLNASAQASDVKKKIENALKRRAEIEAKAIRVSVSNDKVTLDGKVSNWDERLAAQDAAWSAPGVRFVVDHLTIGA
jgi:osmotically-inducible protein OsmY